MTRAIYTSSRSTYEQNRGFNALSHERVLRQQRRAKALNEGESPLSADVKYLLGRRKEVLYRWFSIVKWLRLGFLASGDPARLRLLGGLSVFETGAHVQTHRSREDDCQAAHLMHCNLQFGYEGRRCDAFRLLTGRKDAVVDYRQFVKNIFAAAADVFSIVNEIDSFLEGRGAKTQLVRYTEDAFRHGMEPMRAVADFMADYCRLVTSCQSAYENVINRYEAGDSSIEGRAAGDKSVSGQMKRHRKLALHQEYLDAALNSDMLSPEMMKMIDYAHRSRHEAWGKAPISLLAASQA